MYDVIFVFFIFLFFYFFIFSSFLLYKKSCKIISWLNFLDQYFFSRICNLTLFRSIYEINCHAYQKLNRG